MRLFNPRDDEKTIGFTYGKSVPVRAIHHDGQQKGLADIWRRKDIKSNGKERADTDKCLPEFKECLSGVLSHMV